jgi:small-conductance mechanosensitive channel
MATMTGIVAQTDGTTTTTVPAEVEIVDPSRPISDWLIEVFDLDPDGNLARFLTSLVEPLLQIVVTIVVAWVILKVIRSIGRRFIDRAKLEAYDEQGEDALHTSRRGQRLEALWAVLTSILGLVVWAGALLVILGTTFGVSLAPFLAGAGIIGIALGFGAQDLIKDFVSGVFMLIEDQYGVGDTIDVGDAIGEVEKITLRTTRLRDVNGTVWYFPNGEIRHVGNQSLGWSRALLDVTVSINSDIDRASEVILGVAEEMAEEPGYERLFLAPPEVLGVENVGVGGVVIRLVVRTASGEQWAISRELRRRMKLALDEAGIEMPLPQGISPSEPAPPSGPSA